MTINSLKALFSKKEFLPEQSSDLLADYARLITENIHYIESSCRREILASQGGDYLGSGSSQVDLDNKSDELYTAVLEHLKADDFKVMRQYEGRAKITTYLSAVISKFFIDTIRQKKGRSRAKERATAMGELGVQLYELVFQRRYSLGEAHAHLELVGNASVDEGQLRSMLDKMYGRDGHRLKDDPTVWPYRGKEVWHDGEYELIVPDPSANAEELLIDSQAEAVTPGVLHSMMAELSGEEQFIIRMRFPLNEDEPPLDNFEIAGLINVTEKAVEGRVRRILQKCREMIMSQGYSLDDLLTTRK